MNGPYEIYLAIAIPMVVAGLIACYEIGQRVGYL